VSPVYCPLFITSISIPYPHLRSTLHLLANRVDAALLQCRQCVFTILREFRIPVALNWTIDGNAASGMRSPEPVSGLGIPSTVLQISSDHAQAIAEYYRQRTQGLASSIRRGRRARGDNGVGRAWFGTYRTSLREPHGAEIALSSTPRFERHRIDETGFDWRAPHAGE